MAAVNKVMVISTRNNTGDKPTFFNVRINNFVHPQEKDHPNRSVWGKIFHNYFSEYCSASGIHGIQYLGERGRFLIEKLFWSILTALVWYFCIILILEAYNKWVTSPVIVTFASKETAIYTISFPAVTICPEVKSDPTIFNYTNVLLNKLYNGHATPLENQYFESFSLICTGSDGVISEQEKLYNSTLTVSSRVMEDMLNALPIISEDQSDIWWLEDEVEFDEVLSHTFTSEGLCYSFNMLHFDDIRVNPEEYVQKCSIKNTKSKMWTLEEGYSSGDILDAFPFRTFIAGLNGGFEIDIFTNHSHMDYLCTHSLQGFKVTLHHPSELPNMDRHFRLPLDQAVFVAVKPTMITVSNELKAYKAKDRQCYFATERSLAFFKSYTQQNCLAECLSNYTLMTCGCAAFYMPKFESTPICGPGSKKCITISNINYIVNPADLKRNITKNNNISDCNCLPSCTSLEYDVEISQSDWAWKDSYRVFDRARDTDDNDFNYEMSYISRLTVYYRDMQFLPSERREVYGYVDFFSNAGGLLGLFIGFSVTSAFEILYFLTFRLVCSIKKIGSGLYQENRINNRVNRNT